MLRIFKLFTLLSILYCFSVSATPLRISWDVDVETQYNYVTSEYDAFSPIKKTSTVIFDNVLGSQIDYGTTSITEYGELQSLEYFSPIASSIPSGKFGANFDNPSSAYAFSVTYDYQSNFIEEIAVLYSVYAEDSLLNRAWWYSSQIRFDIRTASKGGDGTNDYVHSVSEHLDLYMNALNNKSEFSYFEYFGEFDQTTGTYLDGYLWSGTGVLSSIETLDVPEPSVLIPLLSLLTVLFCLKARSAS